MRIAMVGLGKLGLPVLLAIESKGHEVMGCETDELVRANIMARRIPYQEPGAQELLEKSKLWLGTPYEAVEFADIVFVAVQTPHAPEYEGATPLPDSRADFDYRFLKEAVSHIAEAAERQEKYTPLVIISTVLPGTLRREIVPLVNEDVPLIYNPSFIAMGSTIHDFLNPEFVLLGSDGYGPVTIVAKLYKTLHDQPVIRMGIEEAELTKVAYNTFITSKIVFANTLMEICELIGADVDVVTDALSRATDRVISPKYLRGGMGDGGGCHPRDNIALSWLARNLGLSHDLFGSLMLARERQARWLAFLLEREAQQRGLPIAILGKAFKAGSNITVGSPAILVRNLLAVEPKQYDPYVDDEPWVPDEPHVFLIGTFHWAFADFPFPAGSVVLDPWGYIADQADVTVRRIGRRQR